MISSISYDLKAFNSKLKANVFYKHYNQNIEKMDPVLMTGANGQQYRAEKFKKSDFSTSGYGMASSYLIKDAIALLFSAEKALSETIVSDKIISVFIVHSPVVVCILSCRHHANVWS